MKTLKNVGLLLFQLVSGFISLLVIYLLIVMFAASITVNQNTDQQKEVSIYVKSNGVHTDLIFPVVEGQINWKSFIDTSVYPQKSFKYISFGWGDQAFFIHTPKWEDLTLETTINALFLDSPCAMHVMYYQNKPKEDKNCVQLKISRLNYKNVVQYVRSSFEIDNGKAILIPEASYWGVDRFYQARGNYHLFNTCNNWSNEGLKIAGIQTARFAVFPKTVLAYCKRSNTNK